MTTKITLESNRSKRSSRKSGNEIIVRNEFNSNSLKDGDFSGATHRKRDKDVFKRALSTSSLKEVVRRQQLFNSVGHSSFDSEGLLARADTTRLTVTNIITDPRGLLWLAVFEVSFFVNAVSANNEWPNGSFFTADNAVTNRANYRKDEVIKEFTSTDSSIRHTVLMVNNSGSTVSFGIKVGMRFILNDPGSPA